MSGPWEKYAATPAPGPWEKYAQPAGEFHNSVGRFPKPNPNAAGADPTVGRSFGQNAVEGFGKSFVDTYHGMQQMGGRLADHFDPQNRTAAVDELVNQSRHTDAPLMNTGGGTVGNIAGQATQMAIPIPGGLAAKGTQLLGKAAPIALDALRAGTFGASQGVADGESRGMNSAVNAGFGAAGSLLPAGLAAAGRKAEPVVDATKQKALQTLERLGIPVHLSQTLDSGFLKLVSSVVNKLPFSGVQAAGRNQRVALSRALGRTMGLDGVTKLSDDVIATAVRRQSADYNQLFGRNAVRITPDIKAQLDAVKSAASSDLTPAKARIVENQVNKFIDKVNGNGEIAGRAYQQIRLGMKNLESDAESGHLVKEVRKVMEKAANQSFTGNDAALLKQTNGRFANRKVIEQALKQVAGAGEEVSPSALWPIVNGAKGSTKEMREIARAGQVVLKNGIPDSGTSQREMVNRLFGLGGGAGAATALGVLPMALKATAVGAGVGRVLNSPAAARIIPGMTSKTLKSAARVTKPAPQLLPAAMSAWKQQDEQR